MKSGEDSGGKYSKWQQTAETKKKKSQDDPKEIK